MIKLIYDPNWLRGNSRVTLIDEVNASRVQPMTEYAKALYNIAMDKKIEGLLVKRGEYYADLDLKTNLWCVFHTETVRAYASFSSEAEAKEEADKRNRPGDK